MPSNDTIGKVVDLGEIATEVLLKELKRRAVAKGMTTEDLLAEARKDWDSAGTEAEDLRNRE